MFLFKNYVPEKLSERIFRDLSEKLNPNYFYHNLFHTKRVIKSALKIVTILKSKGVQFNFF